MFLHVLPLLCCAVYDLEPQKLTGVVKYIGKVDSEFVDNRIYVGVRLDESGVCACSHIYMDTIRC